MDATTHPLEVRATEAIRHALAEALPELAANIRRADDIRPVDGLQFLIAVRIIGLRESFPESDEREGTLIVALDSETNSIAATEEAALDTTERAARLAAHHARAAALTAALDNVQAIIDLVNAHAADRPCSDLTLYDLDVPEEPGGSAQKDIYSFELRKNITVAGVDYAVSA